MPDNEQQDRINLLAKKWLEGTITPEEKIEFDAWYDSKDNTFEFAGGETHEETEHRLYNSILKKGNIHKQRTLRLWPRIAAAASILLVLSFGGWLLLHKTQAPQQVASNLAHDVAPGHSQATLTLAGGRKILLTEGLHGQLAQQGATNIAVNSGNAVQYSNDGPSASEPMVYNTMSTGRGEMSPYPLVLADGTKVWLDAASSVTFPTVFKGTERKVSVTGQAYFEVVHNGAQPFRVTLNGVTVEDVGTKFVVNGYSDEPGTKTTLVEGAVKVIAGNVKAVTIKSGQAALFRPGNTKINVSEANIEAALAWKNGYFRFNDEHIDDIMRQLARWYNIEVAFEGKVSQEEYNGRISRFKNISQVLDMLSTTNTVHFKVEGRRVTVMK